LAGCSPDYSANSYNSTAVQQANKVDQAVVIGRRLVGVTPAGTTGAVAGAAAGGIAGSQVGTGVTQAFGALSGGLVGGVVGQAAERAAGETKAYEYVVRKTNGDLLSVTQQDANPLEIGQKVLVIAGSQARIVADYTVALDPAPPEPHTEPKVPPPAPVTAAPLPPPADAPASPASPAP
jgi:outer membrane lipoprotein SlyB